MIAVALPVNPLVTNVNPYQYAVHHSLRERPILLPVSVAHRLRDGSAVGIVYFPHVVGAEVSFLSSGPVAFIVLRMTAGRLA